MPQRGYDNEQRRQLVAYMALAGSGGDEYPGDDLLDSTGDELLDSLGRELTDNQAPA